MGKVGANQVNLSERIGRVASDIDAEESARIPPSVQAERDRERVKILQAEYERNPSDPNLLAELNRASPGFVQSKSPFLQRLDSVIRSLGSPELVDRIPGMTREVTPKSAPVFDIKGPSGMLDNAVGAGEAALTAVTGAAANLIGNAAGAFRSITGGKFGTQEGVRMGEARAREIADSLTYQPRTEAGKEAVEAMSGVLDASKLQGVGPAEAVPLSAVMAGPKVVRAPKVEAPAPRGALASVGAAGAADESMARALVANASPELKSVVEGYIKRKEPIHMEALKRQVEADSLPVPVTLTKGQATGDVVELSNEQNARAKNTSFAARFNDQNRQLVENADAIREAAAPDVFVRSKPEKGEILIKAYESKDAALSADISAKYKALADANGGEFPLDAKSFVSAADQALHKALKYDFLPAEYRTLMGRLSSGGTMTFEQFESMRTNLAQTIRSAKDGNVKAAASIVRDALENLPMPQGAENLKSLADAARAAARERFDLIKRDPAYKAVVEGKASADKFIDRYVIGGDLKGVNTMKQNLSHDPVAGQTMAAGAIDHLTEAARIRDGNGNFSQAGYNKALAITRPKVRAILNPDQVKQLETLGNVARYTQEQPRGSFVNNSNTMVAAMADKVADVAEHGTNILLGGKLHGIPVGSMVREGVKRAKVEASAKKSLAPGAGVLLRDIARTKK